VLRAAGDRVSGGRRTLGWENAWLAAAGYFAAYVPYAALTKWLTSGTAPRGGFTLLPIATIASVVCAAAFLGATGWWRHAAWRTTPWRDVRLTIASGVCSSAIIATTTLAYTFTDSSILLMMLLLRGGVLVLAPIVDVASKRRIALGSWLALGASLSGVAVAAAGGAAARIGLAAAVDVAIYLLAYFVRLRAMSHLAKTDDVTATRRYFVQEQMVSTPVLLVVLATWAALGQGSVAADLADGFTLGGTTAVAIAVAGVMSQGTGIFGALVLLGPRENTFSVPLNRAASLLAGIAAEGILVAMGVTAGLRASELAGAGLVLAAVVILARSPRRR
jgi:hypothetical protein